MKIFIPYLHTGDSRSLKYTLRSIEKFMPNTGVVICGSEIPKWLRNVEFIKYDDQPGVRNKGNNTHGKMLHCLDRLGEDFIAYSDDFFLLKKWEYQNYCWRNLLDVFRPNNWGEAVKNTMQLIGNAVSFEVHCPIVFNSAKIKALNVEPVDFGHCVKSLYCHTYNIQGVSYPDVKFRSTRFKENIQFIIAGRKFFSTHPDSWNGDMEAVMEELYPERSWYEG